MSNSSNQKYKPISIKQLLDKANNLLALDFSGVYLHGEISSINRRNNAIYLTIKDSDINLDAKIDAVIFLYQMDFDTRKTIELLKVGNCIELFGNLDIYVHYGKLTLKIQKLRIIDKIGEHLLKREQYLQYIISQGYNLDSRKKQIPYFVKNIAIITSLKGDAYQDMLNVIGKYAPDINIFAVDTLVQGDKAKLDIASSIYFINQYYSEIELIIVGRGGGASEDLFCFSELEVIEAIVSSKIPIISAVGHQTDNPLSDLVADAFAITPTAAAHLISDSRKIAKDKLLNLINRLENSINIKYIENYINKLSVFENRVKQKNPLEILNNNHKLLTYYIQRINNSITNLFKIKQQNILSLYDKLNISIDTYLQYINIVYKNSVQKHQANLEKYNLILGQKQQHSINLLKNSNQQIFHIINNKQQQILHLSEVMDIYNPFKQLKRGYSIVENKQGININSYKKIKEQQLINIKLSDSTVEAKVLNIIKK